MIMWSQMKKATLVLIADVTDKLLSETEEVFYSYTKLMQKTK